MQLALLTLLFAGCEDGERFPPMLECGDRICNAEYGACVIDQPSAECIALTDTAASCPEGTEPDPERGEEPVYCCEPAPEPTFRCVPDSTCEGTIPSCNCLSSFCADECEDVEPANSRTIACTYDESE